MSSISRSHFGLNNYNSHGRPFRRFRYPVTTGWVQYKEPFFKAIDSVNKIGCSLLGKVVIYAAADTTGAMVGDALGSAVLEKLGSTIGKNLMSPQSLAIIAGSEVLVSFSSISKVKKINLIAISVAILALIALDESENYGYQVRNSVCAKIGSFLGAIFGGYFCLWIVGSPTVLWDPKKKWDCYLSNTAKFFIIGMVFESVIVNPSTIPWIGPVLSVPREITRITLQNMAYNSNNLFLFFKENLKNKTLGKPNLPILASTAINTYCGLNAKTFTKKFSQCSLEQIFPSLAKSQFDVIKKIDRVLPLFIVNIINKFTENSDKLVAIAISAFHEYINLLTESIELIEAHQKFKDAFLNQTGDHLNYKQQIIKILREQITTDSYLREKVIRVIIEHAWSMENNQQMMKTLGELIEKMEVSLVGFSFTNPRQSSYLNEILDVYLEHYFIFLLLNYNKLESLTSEKECQSLLALSHIIFAYYADSIPRPLTKTCDKTISFILEFNFKMKNAFDLFLYEPEQTSGLFSSEVAVIPDYINVNGEPSFNPSVNVASLMNKDSPIEDYYK